MFLVSQHNCQNSSKNDPPSGLWAPPRGTIFLSEILILVRSISYLSMVKKPKWFLIANNSVFQNNAWEISKILKIWGLRDIFSFFFRR